MTKMAGMHVTELDLAFAMDCTGSMSSQIASAQQNIKQIAEAIVTSENCDVRLALVEYRDHPPEDETFVTRCHNFTDSVSVMKRWLDASSADGGGDTPEAVTDALQDVANLSWRPNAIKISVLVADAPPHGLMQHGDHFPNGCPRGIDPMVVIRDMARSGITLYMIGCGSMSGIVKEFFEALAYITGGQYVPLTDAQKLTQVIIGGAREEVSLQQWRKVVNVEVRKAMNSDVPLDEDALSERIHEKLEIIGARTKQLMLNNQELSTVSAKVKQIAMCTNLRDVQRNFGTASGGFVGFLLESNLGFLFGGGRGSGEVFEAVERGLSLNQVKRMVKQAILQNT